MKRHLYWPWHLFLINFNKIKCNKFEIYKCKCLINPHTKLSVPNLMNIPHCLLSAPSCLWYSYTFLHSNEQHITCNTGSSDSNYLTSPVLSIVFDVPHSNLNCWIFTCWPPSLFNCMCMLATSALHTYFWAIHLLFFVVCYCQFTRRNNLCLSMQNWRPIQIIVAWLPSSDTLS